MTGRRLLIVLLLLAMAVLPSSFAQAAETAAASVSITAEDGLVSVFAVSADAHDVLSKLARETGLPIIVDDTVDRKITLNLVGKQPREILATIVDTYGLSFAEVDNIFILSEGIPNSPSSYLLSEIGSYTTQYVSASQARDLMPAFLTRYVKANASQNAVVLSAPEAVLRRFREDIEQFDRAPAQIMLDVLVVEFTDVNTEEFMARIGWDNSTLGVRTDSLTGDLNFTALTELPTNFFAYISAMVTARKARVRACPSIATVSGSRARIFIGTQQFLEVPVYLPGQGRGNSIDAGVSLTMRPLTGGEGEIILGIEQEISTLGAVSPVTGLPEKTTRSADTTVRVRDGQTLIIGGLKQDESREVHSRIPLLADLPIIGEFFKSRDVERTTVDLTIFVTARLLSRTGHLPEDQEALIKQRFLPQVEDDQSAMAPTEIADE
ncbi:MAG: type II secretion system protein GspD [Armatimonadota bacterium]|jgi:type II secretory pathway component GspD/PulD (secretin)